MADDFTRKLDVVEKTKVHVGELVPGMFVTELDRPWEETPFLFQGFEIKSEADIDEIAKHCRFVYIDTLRTRIIRPELNRTPSAPSYFRKGPLPKTTPLAKELEAAKATQDRTSSLIKTFVEDVKFGRSIDVQMAKAAVSECVASVMRNAEALMFLTKIRDRDEYTSQHSFNVSVYSIVLGRYAGLTVKELENLGTCGLLHDMGKVNVPLEILLKEGRLNEAEFAVMKQHTTFGRDILMSGRNIFSGSVDVAYGHHENLDGTGYPRGLEGHQLSQNTKIVAIVDKYDAITADRVYQRGRTHMEAMSILNKIASKTQIDSPLTLGFISTLGLFPSGSIVELTSGEVAIVLEQNPDHRLRPQVLIVRDANKNPIPQRFVDLAEVQIDNQGRPYKISGMLRAGDHGIDLLQYQSLITKALG
jgi:HD-GYP domain-containing protein (c-di-GMP phosphodiesterase class II)